METKNEDEASPQTLQEQMADLQKLVSLQLQTMNLQTQLINNATQPIATLQPALTAPTRVPNVKAPEGHYEMNHTEFRTYKKDCLDFKKLTQYSDEQVVLQLRLNMDITLKQAIDANFQTQ